MSIYARYIDRHQVVVLVVAMR